MDDIERIIKALELHTDVLEAMDRNMGLVVATFKVMEKRIDALEKRISALEDVKPVTKGNIDSDSIFDNPCTCQSDGQSCPSCVRKAQAWRDMLSEPDLPY